MAKEKLWLKPEHFDTLHMASLANGGIGEGQHFKALNEDIGYNALLQWDDPEDFQKEDAANPNIAPHCAVGLIKWAGDGVLEIQAQNDEVIASGKKIDFETWVRRTNADIHPKALPSGTLPDEYDQVTGELIPEDNNGDWI
jgi:hypothetical protein